MATYPTQPLTYPMMSDRYSVQYKLGGGNWTDARVYISYYGGTTATPYIKASNYPPDTSMSFTSIPGERRHRRFAPRHEVVGGHLSDG